MIKIAIIGATGYTGVELIRLLLNHPQAEICVVTSDSAAGARVSDVFSNLINKPDLKFMNHDTDKVSDCQLVFFATPHATAMHRVPQLLQSGCKVIDLSADYRLTDPAVWRQWYGIEHASPELLSEAVYGLPEIHRETIREARLIANPGCYPTASTLALIPAMKAETIDPNSIIVDAKSGVSGAGRQASQHALYAEVGETFKAYGLSGHRHLPEISQTISEFCKTTPSISFVPHLLPINRGILATIYAVQLNDLNIQKYYEEYYHDEPFVEVLAAGSQPDTRSTRGSNMCRIALYPNHSGDRLVIVSVIDNLVKGAAGQAIQNMNILFGLDERMGLETIGFYP